jgi:hypothetical protein
MQMEDSEPSLYTKFVWLKLFHFAAQVIIADNFKRVEALKIKQSQDIKELDGQGECNCAVFKKWFFPCEHML